MKRVAAFCLAIAFLVLMVLPGLASVPSEILLSPSSSERLENERYTRIVVLSDAHLPTREKDPLKALAILEAKRRLVDDINSWNDVDLVVVLGDTVARFGNESEYAYAKAYFSRISKPLHFVTGNHDYLYSDRPLPFGKLAMATPAERIKKLQRFMAAYHLKRLYDAQRVGGVLLVFLSIDEPRATKMTQMSADEVAWFRIELAQNRNVPTIVFFHAPLKGTLANYNQYVNTPNYVAQPEKALSRILASNPQVLLWVSGHTHTPATNPSFASPVNLYEGHVLDVHNADLDRITIWTNSLYLYPDHILIRTYNHLTESWMPSLDRTVPLPAPSVFAPNASVISQ